MKTTRSNRLWMALGISILAVIVGFALVGCGPSERAATATPGQPAQAAAAAAAAAATATMPPSPLSVLPTPTDAPPPPPTDAPTPEADPPAEALTVPYIAPNFVLQQSGGGTFTLSKQLDQGPVVLVFFQRGGG